MDVHQAARTLAGGGEETLVGEESNPRMIPAVEGVPTVPVPSVGNAQGARTGPGAIQVPPAHAAEAAFVKHACWTRVGIVLCATLG